jgi:DHA2 family multidrug resistance protein-like MFS transporter
MTERASRREWTGLIVIALPCLVYAMDLTVLNLAVPAIAADLQPGGTELLWIIDVYGFLVAGSLITMGTLGDRIGRRRLLLIGAAAFSAASVLAAFATSAAMLIAARALLGLAGGTLAPSTLSLIRVMFRDPHERTVAIGAWITSYSAGAAIGPLAGGALLEVAWWGSVFLIGLPVMALLLVLGPRLLPEYRDPSAGRLDLRSAALSLIAVLAVIYGLKHVAEHGVTASGLAWVSAGALAGATFARRQTRLADPLIDLQLFRKPAFSAALATNLLGFFAVFGASLFTAQYLQSVLGMSPLEAGLWTLPEAAAFIASSTLTPKLVRRVAPPLVIAAGLVVGAAGLLIVAQVSGDLAPVVVGTVVVALGLGPVATLATDLVVGIAPPERAGAASAVSETGSELGGALGIAILGSIATAVYRAGAPAGAKDTIGGAVATGDPAVVDGAREAFTQGMQVASSIAAAVLLAAAVVVLAMLRRPGSAQHEYVVGTEPRVEPVGVREVVVQGA